MLTHHDARPEHDAPAAGETRRAPGDPREAPPRFPALEEPPWLEGDRAEEIDEPRDSALRGIWIGAAAAAVTFVLVFAIPHWLGWYDLGAPDRRARRETTPESVIATVTAKPSGATPTAEGLADGPAPAAAAPVAPTMAAAVKPPVAQAPAAPAVPAPTRASAKSGRPDQPAVMGRAASKRTFTLQIAAFKSAGPANRLAARVKRDGYAADVHRVESSKAPWVVRIGRYSSREQAESARDALARKGFRGFIL